MQRLDFISGIFWFFFSILAAVESYHLSLGSWQKPGSGFFPFLAAAFLGLLSLFIILQSLLVHKEVEEEDIWPQYKGWLKVAIVLIALLGYGFIVEKLGFLVTTFLLISLLLKTIEPQSWLKAIIFSFLGTVFSYLLFHTWLKVPLPTGFFTLMGY